MSSQSNSEPLTHKDYTIGWVCALPKEQTAARAMLEKRYPRLWKPKGDHNVYTLGSIKEHNVVIACLPKGKYGNNRAAVVITSMLSTFPSITFVLLVGIGGGVPPKVRLGDVVVGTPGGQFPGVVQWDMGKAKKGGKYERTGALDNPPSELLAYLGALETEHELNGSKIPEYLERIKIDWPSLVAKYLRSDSLEDVLFKANYDHLSKPKTDGDASHEDADQEDQDDQDDENDEEEDEGEEEDEDEEEDEGEEENEDEEDESCKYCDRTKVVRRKPREMRVHYGLIASGNRVIKYAKRRDKINKDLGGYVLCFEMEAAGILTRFPCLVIRGICDYADSHKNKAWQEHAAAVAAAFAKEFLHEVDQQDVDELPVIKVLKSFHRDKETQKILNWISPFRFADKDAEILKDKTEGTGTWVLEEPRFVKWTEEKETKSKVKGLWCHGIPGAGKTVVAAIVSNHLRNEYCREHANIGVATLYCDYQSKDSQDLDNLQRSIYHQALEYLHEIPDDIRKIYTSAPTKPPPLPDVSKLSSAFERFPNSLTTLFVVLDALDEASETVQDHIVEKIKKLPFSDIRLLCTSRPFGKFKNMFKDLPWIEIKATDKDITTFVEAKIEGSLRLLSLVENDEKLRKEIVTGIIEKAKDMFLMAKLHIGSVMSAASKTEIRDAMGDLSSGIEETYTKTMQRIRSQPPRDKQLAERTLSWVFGSYRPLNTIELQHSLAVMNLKSGREQVNKDDLPHENIIISVCQGLLIQERTSYDMGSIRAVHYTAAEYFKDAYNKEFPHGYAEIAKACVAYLSQSGLSSTLSSHLYELEIEHEDDEIAYHWGGERIGKRPEPWKYPPVIRQSFPLFFYAGEHWGSHLRDANHLGLPICTSDIFWQYQSTSFKWGYWLVPSGESYYAYYRDDIYKIVYKSHDAVLAVLEQFTENDHDINAVDDKGRTMLFYAINAGHEDAIKFLLAQDGIEINEPESESNDPLSAAISRDLTGVIQTLLSMIAVRGQKSNEEPQESDQGQKRHLSFYSLERLRSLQVKAFRTWSKQGTQNFRMLLEKTKEFDRRDGREFLLQAITKRKFESLDFLLERDLDLQARDEWGNTMLHMAAKMNEVFIIEELLQRGVDTATVNSTGWTALQTALDAGSFLAILQLLRSSTSEIRKKLKFNEQSIPWSDKKRGKEVERKIVSLLILADFTSAKDLTGRTALSWAAEYEGYESDVAMGFLLKLGGDINSCDHSGRTALSYAAAKERYEAKELVKKLLEYGADPGVKDNLGKPPILYAAEGSSHYKYDVINDLLKAGADANIKDAAGMAVFEHIVADLNFATIYNNSKIIKQLLDAGVDLNVKNPSGKTALFSIIDREYEDDKILNAQSILWMLLTAGADPNVKDADGKMLRDYALDRGYRSLSVILLVHECLKLGGDLNSKDASGKTPLFYITESDILSDVQVSMVKALLGAGADPNIQDNEGRTPIFAAGHSGPGEAVWEALEKGGAKTNIKDAAGQRPYLYRHRSYIG